MSFKLNHSLPLKIIVLEAILWANISLLLCPWPPPNGPCIFWIKYLSQKLTSRPRQTPSSPSCDWAIYMTSGALEAGCSRSQCVLGSYSWRALSSPPRFPTCIPTLSTSFLKMFPFLFSSLLSQFPCLTLFCFTSSFFSLLPLLSSSFLYFHSLLFILSSPPLSSLYYCSFLSSPSLTLFSLSQYPRDRGT